MASGSIYEAIRAIAGGGSAVCDTGVARNVDADKGVCDVEIEGKAPAKGALTDIPGNAELDVPTDGGDPDTAAEMAASDAKPATDGTPRRDRIVPMPYMCLLRGFFVPSFESLQHPENQKYPQNTIKTSNCLNINH